MIIAGLLFLFLLLSAFKFATPKFERPIKISSRIISGGLLCTLLILFYSTDVVADNGFKPDFWDQSRGYRNTGTLLNFCLNTRYIRVSEPKGYDSDDVSTILQAALDSYDTNALITGSDIADYKKIPAASQSDSPTTTLAESSAHPNDVVTNPLIDEIGRAHV